VSLRDSDTNLAEDSEIGGKGGIEHSS